MSTRKGRVSNELVAASCAAVLTVYAAGYWRTRDVARRMEIQSQQRRPAPAPAPAPAPPVAVVTAPVEPIVSAPPPPPVAVQEAAPVRKKAPKKAVAAKPAPDPVPEILSVPLEPEPAPVVRAAIDPETLPLPEAKLVDGTYTGWGQSYHGDIEVRVVIRSGRIVESAIATCATRYPCDVIDRIIDQPVRQQNTQVDSVSRATESSDAFYYGLVEALKQALAQ
jgi:uncharacterized protein with FMN-binding domain